MTIRLLPGKWDEIKYAGENECGIRIKELLLGIAGFLRLQGRGLGSLNFFLQPRLG